MHLILESFMINNIRSAAVRCGQVFIEGHRLTLIMVLERIFFYMY